MYVKTVYFQVGRRSLLLFITPLCIVVSLAAGLLIQLVEAPSEAASYSVLVLIYIYAIGYTLSWL